MQNKILIANRGEIAVRIIRACKELGITCVAVYSKADEDSLHVKLADEAICIGEAKSVDSYLNINNIISAAIACGVNAIHPGYGFLSENPKFAAIVEKCNIKFIGPKSDVLEKMGDKSKARVIAKSVKVPIVEGSDGDVNSIEEALHVAARIGYPLLIKAVSGGGGKGISVVYDEQQLQKTFATTKMEAKANFGDDRVYLEKLIENPRHIEIQILADSFGNQVYLFERDCSIQRRNQKVIEEAPSPFISISLRKTLGKAALKIAKAIKYENAGTIEFLVDKYNNYYFMEMNTRVQVEHPITEMISGVDIVKEQIRIAYNNPLGIKQHELTIKGHAIECRINAENPNKNFMPSPGLINNLVLPGGMGVRVDTFIYANYRVVPYYDSMIAKLIVFAPTRIEAIRKMRVALEQFIVDGIDTNIEFDYILMHNPDFVKGTYDTSFLKKFLLTAKENENG